MSPSRRLISAGLAGTFDDHRVVAGAQARIGLQHGLEGHRLVGVIGARIEIAARVAVDDDLRAVIAVRLEQHRVQISMRGDAGRDRLQRLGAADLAAIDRHRAVERHVLRLEGCHARARRARRHSPATRVLLPAAEVVPWIISVPRGNGGWAETVMVRAIGLSGEGRIIARAVTITR